jgi:N-acetylglutamate synthase
MDGVLAAAGFAEEGRTLTLFAGPEARASVAGSAATVSREPDRAWFAARARISGVAAPEQAIYETMLQSIVLPKAFARSQEQGEIAALAYCVVVGGLAVIESVVTDAARRRRGHGRQVVGSLLAWARTAGAEAACLQVVADNAPAVALYRALGFTRELYRYRYFRKAAA